MHEKGIYDTTKCWGTLLWEGEINSPCSLQHYVNIDKNYPLYFSNLFNAKYGYSEKRSDEFNIRNYYPD